MLRAIARQLPAPCLSGADLRSRLIQTTSPRSGTRGRRVTAPLYPRGSRIKFLVQIALGHAGEEILKRLAGFSRRAKLCPHRWILVRLETSPASLS
jgi:hypothetical protein